MIGPRVGAGRGPPVHKSFGVDEVETGLRSEITQNRFKRRLVCRNLNFSLGLCLLTGDCSPKHEEKNGARKPPMECNQSMQHHSPLPDP
jgi:hypothetical protein